MRSPEAGWRKLLWSEPVPDCSHPREDSREVEEPGLGKGLQPGGGGDPTVENTFPNSTALGREGAPLPLLGVQ